MSLKSRTIEAVKGAATEYLTAATQIKNILEHPDEKLSTAGLQMEAEAVREGAMRKITATIGEYHALMMEAVEATEKVEAQRQAQKVNRLEYQQALSTALKQIPFAVGNVSNKELRERLAMFENDSFAAPMIKKALKDARADLATVSEVMPKNTNGRAKEIMLAVDEWAEHYMTLANTALLEMQLIPALAAQPGANPIKETYGLMADSFVSYLDGLSNDADFFKPQDYTPAEGEQIHPAATFKMASTDVLGEIMLKYERHSLDEGNSDSATAGAGAEGTGAGSEA